MKLTKELIENTISSAKCCHAKLAWKYFRNLALGIKKECLYSNIKLLRAYINILKGFNIIDEYSECDCCLNGEYSVTLDNDFVYNFQFLDDNTGTLINSTEIFSFTWDQDCNTNNLYLQFPETYPTYYTAIIKDFSVNFTEADFIPNVYIFLDINGSPDTEVYRDDSGFDTFEEFLQDFNSENPLGFNLVYKDSTLTIRTTNSNYNGTTFTFAVEDSEYQASMVESSTLFVLENVITLDNCSFTYTGEFPWYYTSDLNITGTPVPFGDNLLTIELKDVFGNTVVFLDLPIALTKEEIVEYWNSNTPYNTLLFSSTSGNHIYFDTNFGNYDYSYMTYSQYEGGVDSISSNVINSSNFIGEGYTEISVNNSTIYWTLNSFATLEDFILDFNTNNTLGITAFSESPINLTLNSPQYSFESYNTIPTQILTNKGEDPFNSDSDYTGGVYDQSPTCTIFAVNPLDFTGAGFLSVSLANTGIYSASVSSATVADFVIHFNDNNTGGITVSFNGISTLTFTSPVGEDASYNETPFEITSFKNGFNDYNDVYTGGIDPVDSTCVFTLSFDAFTGFGNISIFLQGVLLYTTNNYFETIDEFILDFNENNFSFGNILVSSTGVDNLTFTSFENSQAAFNGFTLNILSYKNTLVSYDNTYSDGVNPEIVTYSDNFETNSSEQLFVTDNPCTPTLNTLTCLTNEQVLCIINKINKICKLC